MVIDDDVKYIGYEDIGKYYSEPSKILTVNEKKTGKFLSEYIDGGILLDLACGDGLFTVPIAKYKTRIVAGGVY